MFLSKQSITPSSLFDLSSNVSTPRSVDVDSCAGFTQVTAKDKSALDVKGVPFISTLLVEGSGGVRHVKATR